MPIVTPLFAQNCLHALLQISEAATTTEQRTITEFHRAAENVQRTPSSPMSYLWRLANGSRAMADDPSLEALKDALLSIAVHCYQVCAAASPSFQRSFDEAKSKLTGSVLAVEDILLSLQRHLGSPGVDVSVPSPASAEKAIASANETAESEDNPPDHPEQPQEAGSAPERAPAKPHGLLFTLPKKEALAKRLTDVLEST